MSNDSHPGVGKEDPLKTAVGLLRSVGNDDLTGMQRVAHADTATVMEAHPAGTIYRIDHRIQNRPVSDGV